MAGYIQGDHLSGKPGNVREFETCQGNVREKILSWKSVPKLFITRWIFAFIWVFSSIQLVINYEIIVNLIVWSFTLKLVLQACYEYHLTWAWVPHIVREMSGNFRLSGEWSPCIYQDGFPKNRARRIILKALTTPPTRPPTSCDPALYCIHDVYSIIALCIMTALYAVGHATTCHQTFVHVFATKYWPIMKTVSLLHSVDNLQLRDYLISDGPTTP